MKRYLTDENRRFECMRLHSTPSHAAPEMELVKVYPRISFQTIAGFGGALTEASGVVYAAMPDNMRQEFMDLYFGRQGNRYSLGRLSIQSCDFSLVSRAYLNNASDTNLAGFSIADDFAYIIPFALDALSVNPSHLLASSSSDFKPLL